MKSSLIYIPAAQFISFTLYLIFSWKIKNQFLAVILDGIHLKRARGVRRARRPHMDKPCQVLDLFFICLIEEIFFALCFQGVGGFVFSGTGESRSVLALVPVWKSRRRGC